MSGAVGEAVGDPGLFEHGGEHVGERRVLPVLEVPSMLEAKASSAGKLEWIILVRVRGAVAAAVDDGGPVEQCRVALRAGRRVVHAIEECRELLREETIPLAQCLGALGLVPIVGQTVKVLSDAEQLRELAAQSSRVSHAGDLVGGHAGRVGHERKMHQLVHGGHVLGRYFRVGVELKPFAVGISQARLGDVDPLLGACDTFFDLPNRVEVFVKFMLIELAQATAEFTGVLHDKIEQAAAAL